MFEFQINLKMVMARCVIGALALLPAVAHSATVVWDYAETEYWVEGDKHGAVVYDYSFTGPYTDFGLYYSQGSVGVEALPPDEPVITVLFYNLCLAHAGDIVCGDAIDSGLSLGGSSAHPAYSYDIGGQDSFYVMFETGTTFGIDNPYYGWAEFNVDSDGNLSLVTIAADMDHDPIVVGARPGSTPEPTSGLLVLLGLAALGLRRANRMKDGRG